ncbi:MAG: hypothetical protein ACPG5U_01250 [Planktomarina sp.]
MKKAVFLIFLAGPAFAELSEAQQTAFDKLQPMLVEQVKDENGATALATCIVTDASNRQLTAMAGDDDVKATAVANKIMADPATMTCMAEELAK